MNGKIKEAWSLFDTGKYIEAEKIYEELWNENILKNDDYSNILFGMIYVKSALNKYDEARKFAALL